MSCVIIRDSFSLVYAQQFFKEATNSNCKEASLDLAKSVGFSNGKMFDYGICEVNDPAEAVSRKNRTGEGGVYWFGSAIYKG